MNVRYLKRLNFGWQNHLPVIWRMSRTQVKCARSFSATDDRVAAVFQAAYAGTFQE